MVCVDALNNNQFKQYPRSTLHGNPNLNPMSEDVQKKGFLNAMKEGSFTSGIPLNQSPLRIKYGNMIVEMNEEDI